MTRRIARSGLTNAISRAFGRRRAVALVGPRQVGKTTLARTLLPADSPRYFDLESPGDLERLGPAMTALENLQGTGLVVIDEVQRRPDLFPILRVLIDRDDRPGQYLLLGSASPQLLRQSSESLAGRLEVIEVDPLALAEVGTASLNELWARGGFPLSFTASSDEDSLRVARSLREAHRRARPSGAWTRREVRSPSAASGACSPTITGRSGMRRSRRARWGSARPLVRRYLDFMTGAFLVRQLQPWFENLAKRQVKSPKVYVRDSGMLHALLNLQGRDAVLAHPEKAGASWEGFLLEQILHHAQPNEAYFWATHQGAELDLLMFKHGRRVGVECKLSDARTHAVDAHCPHRPQAGSPPRRISGQKALHAGPERGCGPSPENRRVRSVTAPEHQARQSIDQPLADGVDGLILVATGAGGHAGRLSPFAYVPEVRQFYDGCVILAGSIASGGAILAAQALGADLAYIGTRFIASEEANAPADYKQMIIDSRAEDIVYTNLFTGVHGNYLKGGIVNAGLDPDTLPESDKTKMDFGAGSAKAKAWRDIWGAGRGWGR